MSVSQTEDDGTVSDGYFASLGDEDMVIPMIYRDNTSVQPAATTKIEANISGNTETHTNLCGDTETEKNGDKNWRVVIEGVVLLNQLKDLIRLRPTDEPLTVVTEVQTFTVLFDDFTWTQKSDFNTGEFEVGGVNIEGPIFTFQLQTKEESNSG